MATFLGLYTIPYIGGKFSIPLYSVSGLNDTFDFDSGFIQEGSLVAITNKGTYSSMGMNTKLENGQYLRPAGSRNNGWGIFNSNSSGSGTMFGLKFAGNGFSPCALGVDGKGNYFIWQSAIYQDNVPNSYEYEFAEPSEGKAGYYVLTRKQSGRLKFNVTVTDQTLINYLNDNLKPFITDPYDGGGESGTGGGGGSFDNTSTPIDIPNLPSISAASTGFISLFNPSLNQLNELASYLWSDLFQVDGWKKLFADPMDAILGLSILPVAIPSGGIREVKVGNIGTGISLTIAASQFVEVDCGSIDVNEYWGAYLDYEPYTQAQIFLPYIGTRPISVDDIMGKTVHVVYHVDILTGACCCFVKCGDSVLYTYNGQCSIPIPITGANYTSVVNGVISIAASVGSLVATGGSSAPTAIPAIASSVVNQMKPQVEKSGSISGSAGVLNMQTPYLILIRPRQALPSKQNEFIGYPSLITVQLTELSGYTEIQSIHLENIPATQEELAEIESLLKGGVIF